MFIESATTREGLHLLTERAIGGGAGPAWNRSYQSLVCFSSPYTLHHTPYTLHLTYLPTTACYIVTLPTRPRAREVRHAQAAVPRAPRRTPARARSCFRLAFNLEEDSGYRTRTRTRTHTCLLYPRSGLLVTIAQLTGPG